MIKKNLQVLLFVVIALAAISAAALTANTIVNDCKNEAGMFSWIQKSTNLVVIGYVEKIQPITPIAIVGGVEREIKYGLATMRVDSTVIGNISGKIQFLVVNHILYEDDGHPIYKYSVDDPWITPGDNIIIALKPVELIQKLEDNQREKVTIYCYSKFVRFLEHEYDSSDQELLIGTAHAEVDSNIPVYGTSDVDPYSFVSPERTKDTEWRLLKVITEIQKQAK